MINILKSNLALSIFAFFLINAGKPALTQINISDAKNGNSKVSQILNEFSVTANAEMKLLNKVDDNYLTKLSGLVTYDRKYLAKNSEIEFFSKSALDNIRIPKMNRELKCLSEALYFEARGEQIEGQIAVADVIINRKKSNQFPSSICGVVSEGAHKRHACQFSYNCDGKLELIYDKKTYTRIVKLSSMILNGAFSDVTNGATFFHASEVSPSWSKKFIKTRKIGRHIFYKN